MVEALRLSPRVDKRETRHDRVVAASGVRPDHATHDRDPQIGIGLFEPLERAQLGLRLVFRVLAHRAGVEHDQIGVAGMISWFQPESAQTRRQLGAIGAVDLAADGPDVELRHRGAPSRALWRECGVAVGRPLPRTGRSPLSVWDISSAHRRRGGWGSRTGGG